MDFQEKDIGQDFQKVIYRAKIDDGWNFEFLTENGHRGVLARYPNQDYFRLRAYLWPGGDTGE